MPHLGLGLSVARNSASGFTPLSLFTGTTSVEAFRNGTSATGATAITGTIKTNSSVLTIGKRHNAATNFLDGRIYGLIHLARPFTSAEHTAVLAYLAAKNGATL